MIDHHHDSNYCVDSIIRFQNTQTNVPAKQEENKVKPYKFSPFQVSTSNKVDYALARLDDLLNFARRVS